MPNYRIFVCVQPFSTRLFGMPSFPPTPKEHLVQPLRSMSECEICMRNHANPRTWSRFRQTYSGRSFHGATLPFECTFPAGELSPRHGFSWTGGYTMWSNRENHWFRRKVMIHAFDDIAIVVRKETMRHMFDELRKFDFASGVLDGPQVSSAVCESSQHVYLLSLMSSSG
jgi:hypothetical protein